MQGGVTTTQRKSFAHLPARQPSEASENSSSKNGSSSKSKSKGTKQEPACDGRLNQGMVHCNGLQA
jgi:hypothetical protein